MPPSHATSPPPLPNADEALKAMPMPQWKKNLMLKEKLKAMEGEREEEGGRRAPEH